MPKKKAKKRIRVAGRPNMDRKGVLIYLGPVDLARIEELKLAHDLKNNGEAVRKALEVATKGKKSK